MAPTDRARGSKRCTGEWKIRGIPVDVIALNADVVRCQVSAGVTRRIDLAIGSRVERSAGYRRHMLLGLSLGTLVGVGAGALLYSGCTTGGEDDGLCGFYYLASVPAGAILGTVVGALVRTERWEAVSAPAVTLHILPLPGRTTIGLNIRSDA